MQNIAKSAKQNYPGSVASDDTRLGNDIGLSYNAPELSQNMGNQTCPELTTFLSGMPPTSLTDLQAARHELS